MPFKFSKAFLSLWTLIAAGPLFRNMGSSEYAACALDIPGATWRIRIGARVTVLERRAHGTPTGRASAGHWQRVCDTPTPKTAAQWSHVGKAFRTLALEWASDPAPWDTRQQGDANRCDMRADSNSLDPREHALGINTGIYGSSLTHSNPSRLDAFGFAPASGMRLLPGVVEQLRRERRRRRNQKRKAARAARMRAQGTR